MLKNKKISLIGTGNMGEALLSGLISSGSSDPKNIICTDVRENRLKSIQEKYGVHTTADNIKAVEASEIIIYAVKPQIICISIEGNSVLPGHVQAHHIYCRRCSSGRHRVVFE